MIVFAMPDRICFSMLGVAMSVSISVIFRMVMLIDSFMTTAMRLAVRRSPRSASVLSFLINDILDKPEQLLLKNLS